MPSVASSSWRWRYWPLQPLLFLLTRPFWPVAVANSVMAVAGDVFGPAVAALTLGLFARPLLARRMGRNAAFDHAGNVAIAVVAGAVGYAFSQRAVFLLVPVFAMLTVIAVLSIPAKAIDYNRARDLEVEPGAAESSTGAPATAFCSSRGRWSSSVCASCCSISPTRHCCRWWDRSSRRLTPRKRRR